MTGKKINMARTGWMLGQGLSDHSGQGKVYFYIFRPGFESAKKVSETESGIDELHSSRYSENLYNRVSI
jgi:hypothetical protein